MRTDGSTEESLQRDHGDAILFSPGVSVTKFPTDGASPDGIGCLGGWNNIVRNANWGASVQWAKSEADFGRDFETWDHFSKASFIFGSVCRFYTENLAKKATEATHGSRRNGPPLGHHRRSNICSVTGRSQVLEAVHIPDEIKEIGVEIIGRKYGCWTQAEGTRVF